MGDEGSNLTHRFCGRVDSRLTLRRKCVAYCHKSIVYGTSMFNWMEFKYGQISKGLHKDPFTFSLSKVNMKKW